jgi:hypothetical protein
LKLKNLNKCHLNVSDEFTFQLFLLQFTTEFMVKFYWDSLVLGHIRSPDINALTVLNESLFFPFIAIMNSVMGLETCPHLTLIYLVLNVCNYLDAEVLNVI